MKFGGGKMSEKEEKKGKINRQKIITAVSWIVCGFINQSIII